MDALGRFASQFLFLLACVLLLCSPSYPGTHLCPLLRATGVSEDDKTGCYMVALKRNTNDSTFDAVKSTLLSLSTNSHISGSVQSLVKSITVPLTEGNLIVVRGLADVDYVEEETKVRGMQDQIPWHLDRMDQSHLPLNERYSPEFSGEGVDLYILDTGINYAHEEFEGRAKYSGYDPIDEQSSENRSGLDCHGHGTHVASLAAGKVFGIAKEVQIYSVRVLDCNNSGTWSRIIRSLEYVSQVVPLRGRPAVVTMAFIGPYSQTMENAVQTLYSRGILSVSSAGSDFRIACDRSPARSIYTLSVGGTNVHDELYPDTNFGSCVDVFAPAEDITGADSLCSTCYKSINGTSASAALVSGAVAMLLGLQPHISPQNLKSKLLMSAVQNVLNFERLSQDFQESTPNRLLQVSGQCGGDFVAPVIIVSPNYPQNYTDHSFCEWTISTRTDSDKENGTECRFTEFEMEEHFDVVTVCDGLFCCPSSPSSILAVLSGALTSSPSYIISGKGLTVQMMTDGSVTRSGFKMACQTRGLAPATETPTNLASPSPPSTPTPPASTPSTPTPPASTPSLPTTFTNPDPELPTLEVVDLPLNMNESDEAAVTPQLVPDVVEDVVEEVVSVLQDLISQSMNGVLSSKVLGRLQPYPATSCQQLAANTSFLSDYYWLKSGNGSSIRGFCDMSLGYAMGPPGYMRVANLNMTLSAETCPDTLKTRPDMCNKLLCGRADPLPGCSSVMYSTLGIPFQRVCGQVLAYQHATPNAFFAHQYNPSVTIDDTYLDGVSLTYGHSPRQHIWSFAAAMNDVVKEHSTCPCTNADHSLPDTAIPTFVKQHFFCDTSAHNSVVTNNTSRSYCEKRLWDGTDCGPRNSCCRIQNHSPWFCVDLGKRVTSDIELRLCGNEDSQNEDTPLEVVYLYVQ